MWNELAAMIVGFGLAVVAFMLFVQQKPVPAPERIVIRHAGPWWGPPSPGGGPYYARLPFRPLFY